MFKLVGMILGVAAGSLFAAILAGILRASEVTPQTIETIALTVSLPAMLLCGALGGLVGYRRDQK